MGTEMNVIHIVGWEKTFDGLPSGVRLIKDSGVRPDEASPSYSDDKWWIPSLPVLLVYPVGQSVSRVLKRN